MNDIFMYMCFSKTPALSRTGDCRPFSDAADGTLLGEGMSMLALKRLADAERDGDRVYAVIRGIGSSSDGRSKSVYAPLPEGQARALRRTYAVAGYGPDTVELVEAHGTATKAGDAAEFEGLQQAFGESGRADRQWCALGSVKSQIGHTKSAAGAAGMFKAVMALHHKVLPPTIKVDRPNPRLEIEKSPFYLNTEARPWIRDASHPRRASVSSFGFGGSNFHVTMEEYTGPAPRAWRLRSNPTELVMLSDATATGLAARCEETARRAAEPDLVLAAVARTSQEAFRASEAYRLSVVASDAADLAAKLEQARAMIASKPEAAFSTPTGIHYGAGPGAGPVAFLFPGQGSQYVGMGAEVAMGFDVARAAWDEAAATRFDGHGVHDLVYPRPVFTDADRQAQAQRLTATEWAQPAIGLTSLALLGVVRAAGITPVCVGGHSFGEITALCAAGALDHASLVAVARRRGELMRDASATPGAMTAVARPLAEVRALIAELGDRVVVANHNHPTQVVLSGAEADVARIEQHLAGKGITAKRLPVATAFHSPLVAPSSARFAEFLAGIPIATPTTEVWSNAEAAPYPTDADAIRARLAEQITRPVRFVEEIEGMWARGARTFLEIGPGGVLSELVDRILGDRPHLAIALDRKGKHGVTSLQEGLGRLAVAGIAVDFAPLWEGYAPPVTTPKKKAAMTILLNGSNHGKPYPPPGGAAALPKPNPPRPKEIVMAPAQPTPAPVVVRAPHQVALAPAPVIAAVPNDAHLAWVRAYQESQRQTAEAHSAYLRTMADTHSTFLRTVESSFSGLSAMMTGTVQLSSAAYAVTLLPTAPAVVALAASPVLALPAPVAPAPMAVAALPPPSVVAMQAPATVAAPPQAPGVDLHTLMLAIVAEKTGYPVEMLGLQMELESDLGIDSIKRVEILSAMRERAPGLPEVNASEMAALRTLGQIVDYMAGRSGKAPAPRAEEAPVVATKSSAIQRFVLVEEPARPCGLVMSGLLGAHRVMVTDDGGGVALEVARALNERGINAEVVDEVSGDPDAVIFLGGLREVATVDDAVAVNREAFRAARAIAARFAAHGGVLVTVQDTGGDFGLAGRDERRAWLGGVSALARTAAVEWPSATVKAVDLERGGRSPEAVARVLLGELFTGGATREVGLHADGSRTRLRSVAREAVPGASVVDPAAVIVVSGGARGVTAASVIALARHARPRIVLLGRSRLEDEPAVCRGVTDDAGLKRALLQDARVNGRATSPAELGATVARILANREIHATLQAIHAAGSEVRYVPVDVQDVAGLRAALDEVRRAWGPITGVVHGAGVLADKLIAEKTQEQFDRVFDTKVLGLRALLDATSGDPLRWIGLFSSVAARTGNLGQCDYAMANEVLNKVAAALRHGRGGSFVAKSIGWGPWEGGMVTPSLKARFDQMGVALIPLAEGARRFVEELEGSPDEVETVVGGASMGDGALGAAAGSSGSISVEVEVGGRTHPYLRDHRVGGKPVVPVAMAIEWMSRAARACGPDGDAVVLRDLKVLRGIKLEHFENGGDRLAVSCKPRLDGLVGELSVELRGQGGVLHYSANVEPSHGPRTMPERAPEPALGSWTHDPVYDGHVLSSTARASR